MRTVLAERLDVIALLRDLSAKIEGVDARSRVLAEAADAVASGRHEGARLRCYPTSLAAAGLVRSTFEKIALHADLFGTLIAALREIAKDSREASEEGFIFTDIGAAFLQLADLLENGSESP